MTTFSICVIVEMMQIFSYQLVNKLSCWNLECLQTDIVMRTKKGEAICFSGATINQSRKEQRLSLLLTWVNWGISVNCTENSPEIRGPPFMLIEDARDSYNLLFSKQPSYIENKNNCNNKCSFINSWLTLTLNKLHKKKKFQQLRTWRRETKYSLE